MEINLNNMTDAEKLNLISVIWDSISVKDDIIPVEDEHKKILDDREFSNSPVIPWEVAKEQIKNALR
jgi:hypothetical protein